MTQAKDSITGEQLICPKCNKKMLVNECDSHKNSPDNCYNCHLQNEHLEEEKVTKPKD